MLLVLLKGSALLFAKQAITRRAREDHINQDHYPMLLYLEIGGNILSSQSQGTDQFSSEKKFAGNNIVDEAVSRFGDDALSNETYSNDIRAKLTHPTSSPNISMEGMKQLLSEALFISKASEWMATG